MASRVSFDLFLRIYALYPYPYAVITHTLTEKKGQRETIFSVEVVISVGYVYLKRYIQRIVKNNTLIFILHFLEKRKSRPSPAIPEIFVGP